jgi:probable HAF family extracellular repeat protein
MALSICLALPSVMSAQSSFSGCVLDGRERGATEFGLTSENVNCIATEGFDIANWGAYFTGGYTPYGNDFAWDVGINNASVRSGWIYNTSHFYDPSLAQYLNSDPSIQAAHPYCYLCINAGLPIGTTNYHFASFGCWTFKAVNGQYVLDGNNNAPFYNITDLGTLGGTYSAAYGINNSGQVTGESYIGGDAAYHAFLYSAGKMTDLGTLGGTHSYGWAINSLGQVCGQSYVAGDGTQHAFLYDGTTLRDLGTIVGGPGSIAKGINDFGQVVGSFGTAGNQAIHAFLYSSGTVADLGTLGGLPTSNSEALAINNSGQITGDTDVSSGGVHTFLYASGVMANIGGISSGDASVGHGINDSGQIVGQSGGANIHAFLYSDATVTDLGTLGGCCSSAFAINRWGQVTGTSNTPDISAGGHAFLYASGTMRDLNDLIPINSGWVLTSGQAINDGDQIAGYGFFQGNIHAFLATPGTPPPQQSLHIKMQSNDPANYVYPLGSGISIVGEVVDDQGNPVSGVQVFADDPITQMTRFVGDPTDANGFFTLSYSSTQTLHSGLFVINLFLNIANLPAVPILIQINPSGVASTTVPTLSIPLGLVDNLSLQSPETRALGLQVGSTPRFVSPSVNDLFTTGGTIAATAAQWLLGQGKDFIQQPQTKVALLSTSTCFLEPSLPTCVWGVAFLETSFSEQVIKDIIKLAIDNTPNVSSTDRAAAKNFVDVVGVLVSAGTLNLDGGLEGTLDTWSLVTDLTSVSVQITKPNGTITAISGVANTGNQHGTLCFAVAAPSYPTNTVTVQTAPAGLSYSVDGIIYNSAHVFLWATASNHTIATSSPQNGASSIRYTWANWSDGKAISHTATATKNTTYTAKFNTQYYLTMSHGAGGSLSPASGWKNSGSVVSISATPTNNSLVSYNFTAWAGTGTNSYTGTNNPASITMNGPITETANFTQNPVNVTVQTSIAGPSFSVDGTTYTSSQTFSWQPGSSHTIATTSPQNGGAGVQYVWKSWSDKGTISHTVAPTQNTTYTATFTTQYFLTMSAGSGGTVKPASGWKNSGAVVSITATPSTGHTFSSWTGTGTGSFSGTTNPASITMGGPITETATFQ